MSARIALCCDVPYCPAMEVASTVERARQRAAERGWSHPGGSVDHCPLHATSDKTGRTSPLPRFDRNVAE